ncbi:MAG: AlpA family phage regulatory protein [Gammaproteobacteria bacterium]|uniref:helix-turn-helix transcriptional regulator n=1 Tax=Nitrosomonas sp. TaxID=42353 RepID=UPI002715AAF9|nr:AlpA family phage regulatory protein [Nitrosomonas sp.]MDO8893724.1 AlpA family phage regulatory protein [Nitrosomonas sp.]MDP1550703.1 AlpA family phage regulatory protein [Nitrosomonas sp.]MDP1931187.1 AlpA family phage regulatory protein [Gammaproteobacteria bacterium]
MNQSLSTPQHQLSLEAGQLPAIPTTERLLPLPEVESRSGFKSSFIYQLIKEGKFPKPVKIGTASRWRESEIQAWIFNQIEGSTSGKRAEVRA